MQLLLSQESTQLLQGNALDHVFKNGQSVYLDDEESQAERWQRFMDALAQDLIRKNLEENKLKIEMMA